MGPAAGILDGGPAPDTRGPIEVEQEMAAAPSRLLDAEVAGDAERLGHGEQGEGPAPPAGARPRGACGRGAAAGEPGAPPRGRAAGGRPAGIGASTSAARS